MEQTEHEQRRAAAPPLDGACRTLLQVDLERDRCTVLKSDLEGWQPEGSSLLGQLEDFARRAVRPEDQDRLLAFIQPEHLGGPLPRGQRAFTLLYRRLAAPDYRWNLMEFIPEPGGRGGLLSVRDIHEAAEACLDRKETDSLRRAEEDRREAERRQALEDRAYIISSLSSLFFSTYYIDLEQDTFRAVTQLRPVGDLLGDVVHYPSGLQLYANHFVHPGDREEYLRVMHPENLRRQLRWWQPCVAVEYRRLTGPGGGGEGVWVRATAVLAQNGADDRPKTAVYVAQEITGGRRPGGD